MAAYVEPQDVRDVLDPDGTGGGSAAAMSDEALQEAIDHAQAEVDAMLRGRYTVPFTSPPDLVVDVTTSIAAYRATLTYRRGKPLEERHPVWLAYQDALRLLKGLGDGSTVLDPGDSDPAPGTEPGGMVVVNRYAGSMFTPGDFDLAYSRGRGLDWRGRRW